MPQKRNSPGPPPTMTWRKASPVIVVAGLLDLLRMFFEMFWFFGPALAGVICTAKVGGVLTTWTTGLLGTGTAAAACGATATVVGVVGAPEIGVFGIIMAEAMGLLGFLILALWLFVSNARLFKVNKSGMLLLSGSLVLSGIPFIGTLPMFLAALFVLYKRQIKVEKAARKRWEREEQLAQIARLRDAQAAQDAQEAANEDQYEAQSPDELLKAA